VSRRRAEILAEMGLAPVWRLRHPLQLPVEPPTSPTLQGGPLPASVDLPASAESRERTILAFDWPALKQRVEGCTDCRLRASCRQTVFGVGDERASWMLVGEAPGADEDRLGEPFVGQAGRLLDNMLAALGLARGTDVYIANVLKCRPPGNRNPQPDEVARCSPYLLRQIGLIRPKLIVAMGRFAAQTLLNTDASIASLRGRVHQYAGVPLVVTYHPAYLLRNLPDKAKTWIDLRFAARTMAAGG
jgi:uracil-DNA glycosylase